MRSTVQAQEAKARQGLEELKPLEQAFHDKLVVAREAYQKYTAWSARFAASESFGRFIVRMRPYDFKESEKEAYIYYLLNSNNDWNRKAASANKISRELAEYIVGLWELYFKKEKADDEFRKAYKDWNQKYEEVSYLINKNYGFFIFPSEYDLHNLVEGETVSYESQYSIPLEDAKKGIRPPTYKFNAKDFLEHLKSQRTKNLEANLYKVDPVKLQNRVVTSRLKKYTNEIASHKTASGEIDFTYEFWFFAESRAKSRKANYELALALQKDLDDAFNASNTASSTITTDTVTSDTTSVATVGFFGETLLARRKLYIEPQNDRGISRGSRLTSIINDGLEDSTEFAQKFWR